MKAFISLFALVAAVAAKADPYFYGYGGYPYAYGVQPYAYGAYAPLTYVAAPETGCTNSFGLPVPCAFKSVEKRSADAKADAEADPQYFYNGAYAGYGYGYGYPYAYGAYGYYPYAYTGCRNSAGAAVPCAYGHHTIAKRDAEADPAYYVSPYLSHYGFPSTVYGQGLVHTSHFGVCINYKGEKVSC